MVQTKLGWRRFLLSQIAYLVVFALAAAPVRSANAQSGEELYERCKEAFATATQACTTPSMTAGMTPQQQQAMMQQQQAMQNAQQQNSGSPGINQNAKMMEIISGAQAAMAGIKATSCATQIQASQSACRQAESTLKAEAAQTNDPRKEAQARDAKAKAEQSSGYKANLAEVVAQMLAMIANFLANREIQAKSGGTKNMDCKNPEFAKSNVQCICEKDPKNPLCGSGVQQGVGASFTGAPGGGVTPSGGRGMDEDFPTIGELSGGAIEGVSQPGTNESAGGGGGGGLGGGGGAPAGNFGNEGGYAGSDINKDVITGQSGGGGGGSGGGGFGGGGGGSGGGGSGADQIDGFDLSKFLPKKSDFNNRGLAGMSVTAKDGITGPMGPSIWEKVSNQYQNQKPKLLLDK